MQTASIKSTCYIGSWIVVIAALLLTTSCSSYRNNPFNNVFRDTGDDYLKANTLDPIAVPPNLDSRAIGQTLKIPETDVLVTSEDATVPPPPQLTVKKDIPRVSIQQLGDKRWILVARSTAEAWPLLVNFLKTKQLTVANSDTSEGILETDWLTLSIDPGNVNKYRLRVDGGVQPDTTEIHIVNLVRSNNEIGRPLKWPQASSDKARENWMINELVEALTNDEDTLLSESLLAQNAGGEDKAYLRQQQGELVLAIALDKQRAYASLTHALSQDEFTLYQYNPKQGIFHVDYLPVTNKEKSPGLTSRLIKKLNPFTSSEEPVSQYTLDDIIAHLPPQSPETRNLFPHEAKPSTVKLDNVPGYLIVIKDDSSRQLVYIRDSYGRPLPLRQSKQLLTFIHRQLI